MSDDVDDVAVERACKGDRNVSLNRAEVAEAIAVCAQRGLSDNDTAELLGITSRTVLRVRHGETAIPFSRPGATVDNTKEKIAVALKHESAAIRRVAQRANADLAHLNTLLASWDAKQAARERVAELEQALAEAKAQLHTKAATVRKPKGDNVHAKARAWARQQGVPCSDIGRVPTSVIEQWKRATAGAA